MLTRLMIAARVVLALCVVITLGFALAPPSSGAHLFPWDKADHFCAFFAITSAAIVAFPQLDLVWIGVAAAALGGGIELAQALPFIDRDCNLGDWIADLIGIGGVMGVLFAAEIRRRLKL